MSIKLMEELYPPLDGPPARPQNPYMNSPIRSCKFPIRLMWRVRPALRGTG